MSHACHVIREQLRLESEQLMKELRDAKRQKDEEERDLAKKEAGEILVVSEDQRMGKGWGQGEGKRWSQRQDGAEERKEKRDYIIPFLVQISDQLNQYLSTRMEGFPSSLHSSDV